MRALRIAIRKAGWMLGLLIALVFTSSLLDLSEGADVVFALLAFFGMPIAVIVSPLGSEPKQEAVPAEDQPKARPAELLAKTPGVLLVLALNGFTGFITGCVALYCAFTADYSTAWLWFGATFICVTAGSIRRQKEKSKELGRDLTKKEVEEQVDGNFGNQAGLFWLAVVMVSIGCAWFYEPESPAEAAAREARLAEDSKRMDAFARNREAVAASIDERVYDRVGFFGVDVFNSVEKAAGVDCGIAPYGGAYHLRSKFQREQLGEEAKVLVQCGNTGAIYIVFVQHDGRHRVIRNRIN